MIFFETTCFEFPRVAGAHFTKISGSFFPKIGGSFSQSRWLISPKSVAHFFPKSVDDFPKVGGSFSRSRSLIFPKSVADFPRGGDGFSISRQSLSDWWSIFPSGEGVFCCLHLHGVLGKLKARFGHDDILLAVAASRNKRTSELEEQLKSVCLHVALYNNWRAEIALQRPLSSYMIDRFTPP